MIVSVFQQDFSSHSKDEKLKAGKSWYHWTIQKTGVASEKDGVSLDSMGLQIETSMDLKNAFFV